MIIISIILKKLCFFKKVVVQGKKNEGLVAWGNMKLKDFRADLAKKFPEISYEE